MADAELDTGFNATNVDKVRALFKDLQKDLTAAYGFPVTVEVGRITYTATSLAFKTQVLAATTSKLVPGELPGDAAQFTRDHHKYGLRSTDRLREFHYQHMGVTKRVKILTVVKSCPKYPVLVFDLDTKTRIRLSTDLVQKSLPAADPGSAKGTAGTAGTLTGEKRKAQEAPEAPEAELKKQAVEETDEETDDVDSSDEDTE